MIWHTFWLFFLKQKFLQHFSFFPNKISAFNLDSTLLILSWTLIGLRHFLPFDLLSSKILCFFPWNDLQCTRDASCCHWTWLQMMDQFMSMLSNTMESSGVGSLAQRPQCWRIISYQELARYDISNPLIVILSSFEHLR